MQLFAADHNYQLMVEIHVRKGRMKLNYILQVRIRKW
jgi:hypothetical protein